MHAYDGNCSTQQRQICHSKGTLHLIGAHHILMVCVLWILRLITADVEQETVAQVQ